MPSQISNYLAGQSESKKLLLVSFFITNPQALAQLQREWALRKAAGKAAKSTVNPKDYGGSVALMDPAALEQGFIHEMELPFAFGLCFNGEDRSLYVASSTVIRQIRGGRCVRVLNNNLFNDLHSLNMTLSGGLLVVSTGTDSVVEIDFENPERARWDWLAIEQGYNTNPMGQIRSVDRHLNCQLITTTTPQQTTHINTAFNVRPGIILATLFHQGQLIEIDMKSKESRVLLSGLRSPHNIRKTKQGFILSDSRANRALLLNRDFQIVKEITDGYDWVQDALEFEDGLYLLADSNNGRILSAGPSGKLISSFSWGLSSRKVSVMELVTVSQAKDIFVE